MDIFSVLKPIARSTGKRIAVYGLQEAIKAIERTNMSRSEPPKMGHTYPHPDPERPRVTFQDIFPGEAKPKPAWNPNWKRPGQFRKDDGIPQTSWLKDDAPAE